MKIEDAIMRYENWAEDDRIDSRIRKEHEQIAEWLKELQRLRPSADRPQGEWIVSDKDSVCSVCGKDEAEFICGTEDWYGYGLSNYCPNCGERMKGADDE